MSVLVDHEIRHYCEVFDMISPYDDGLLQPASYDVRLGSIFQKVDRTRLLPVRLSKPETFSDLYERHDVGKEGAFFLPPGGFALACTEEIVKIPPDIVSRIQGKSSLGRLGLVIETAGYIDPGFRGSVTMEIYNLLPVGMYLNVGSTIAQLSFEYTSARPEKTYQGRYQGDVEATGSRYTG